MKLSITFLLTQFLFKAVAFAGSHSDGNWQSSLNKAEADFFSEQNNFHPNNRISHNQSHCLCVAEDTLVRVYRENVDNSQTNEMDAGAWLETTIDQLEYADKVMGWDTLFKTRDFRIVFDLISNQSNRLVKLSVNGKDIKATPDHRFYCMDTRDFVLASDLTVGNHLQNSEGMPIKILGKEELEGTFPVYNLQFFENADFFADGVLVGSMPSLNACQMFGNPV